MKFCISKCQSTGDFSFDHVYFLTPLNKFGQPYQPVIETSNDYVAFKDSWLHPAKVGEKYDYYRFNPTWKSPIGKIQVVENKNGIIQAKIIKNSFVYQLLNKVVF